MFKKKPSNRSNSVEAGSQEALASNEVDNTTSFKAESNEIEQGNVVVKIAAFLAGLASCVSGVMQLINVSSLFVTPIFYILAAYQVIFALTIMLFEANPEWVVKTQDTIKLPVSSYQDTLMRNAAFLTYAGGRGMFYVFLGSLWFGFHEKSGNLLTDLLTDLTGLALLIVGIMHILMHFGIMPHHIVSKVQEVGQGSYDHITGRTGH